MFGKTQAEKSISEIIQVLGPILHRMNFDEDFEYWMRREHISVVKDCEEEFFDAVYAQFYEREDDEEAKCKTFDESLGALLRCNFGFKTKVCENCSGSIIYKDEASIHRCSDNGTVRLYCEQCYHENFVQCDHCGKTVHREDCVSAIRNRLTKYYCKDCAGMLLSAEDDE